MKALSIRQPWCWAILHAGKDVENRRWRQYARNLKRDEHSLVGEFYIHASKRPGPTEMQRETLDFIDFCRERGIKLPDGAEPGKLTMRDLFRDCGGIVGVARITRIVSFTDPLARDDSLWAIPGCIGLMLAGVRPVPLVPCKGALGFWNVPADVQAQIARAAGS